MLQDQQNEEQTETTQADVELVEEKEKDRVENINEVNNNHHVHKLEFHKDIYNTIVVLKLHKTKTEDGNDSSLWNAKFSSCDKAILYFFNILILIIQISGFALLESNQRSIEGELQEIAKHGEKVTFKDGTMHNILLSVRYNITGQFNLFQHDNDQLDAEVYLSIVIADICLVILMMRHLLEAINIFGASHYFPEHCVMLKLTGLCKGAVIIALSFVSMSIISTAEESIEAMARAVEIFILVEISEWFYEIINQHSEIHDHLFDLAPKIEVNDKQKLIPPLVTILAITTAYAFTFIGYQTAILEEGWRELSNDAIAQTGVVAVGMAGAIILAFLIYVLRKGCKDKSN